VIVDSGVCNYDEPKRVGWYCKPEAHNTLIVDGAGDYDRADIAFSKEPVAACRIVRWESNEKYDVATMVHDGFGNRANPIRWVRHIILIKGMFVIVIDEVISQGIHDYAWPFHFLPGELRVNRNRKSVQTASSGQNVLVMPASPDSFDACEIGEGWINQRSKSLRAPVARYRTRGSSIVCAFCLFPDTGKEVVKVSVQQIVKGKTILIDAVFRSKSVRVQLPRWKGSTATLSGKTPNTVVEVLSTPIFRAFDSLGSGRGSGLETPIRH
jgi:Heparinase II/III-like protein